MELSKNTLCSSNRIGSQLIHMVGQMLVIQEIKGHITAQLVEMLPLVEPLLMHITNVAFTLESISQEQMQK